MIIVLGPCAKVSPEAALESRMLTRDQGVPVNRSENSPFSSITSLLAGYRNPVLLVFVGVIQVELANPRSKEWDGVSGWRPPA